MSFKVKFAATLAGLMLAPSSHAAATDFFESGRLLATGGVSQIEGAGGAGLTTWALITGYGTENAIGANVHHTYVSLDDFTLNSSGVAVGLYDRLELSYAKQWFDTGEAGGRLGLGEGFEFSQDIYGAKLRLFGDAVIDQDRWLPQISIGLQHKNASQEAILSAVGAGDNKGTDFYIAATKLFLRQSLLVNATARFTEANQYGLLGFGNSSNSEQELEWEFSAAYLATRKLVFGADYRTKPDNLAFAEEQDSKAIYAAYFPNKNISITAAVVDLGAIALQGRQQGFYLSLQAGF